MKRASITFFVGALGLVSAAAESLRGPVAMELLDDGKAVAVALERRGGLALIDTRTLKLRANLELDFQFADFTQIQGGRLIGIDHQAGKAALIEIKSGKAKIVSSIAVGPYPVTVVAQPNSGRVFVASLWSKKISVVELIDEDTLFVAKTIPLPFEPREMQLVDPEGRRLVVADAFGGQLALLNVEHDSIESIRQLPGHNIGGLALHRASGLLFATHQNLNRLAQTSFDDIHWGMFLTNKVRAISFPGFFESDAPTEPWNVGDVGEGGGDPDAVAILPDGKLAIALAGTGEVLISKFGASDPKRIETGLRPRSLLVDRENRQLYIASELDDLITVVDLDYDAIDATIALTPGLERDSRDRGERLFFNAQVSHDGWFSCHSCHTDGHTNGLAADTLGDGGYGAPKQIPSLFGLAGTAPFGWIGGKPQLTEQVSASIHTTMRHGDPMPERDVADLVTFLESLPPPPQIGLADSRAIERGKTVFHQQRCDRCHTGSARTTDEVFDVGLVDAVGNEEFNPPSLRGVALRRRFFHDGRVDSLEAVIADEKHQLESGLNAEQQADLLAFLRSL